MKDNRWNTVIYYVHGPAARHAFPTWRRAHNLAMLTMQDDKRKQVRCIMKIRIYQKESQLSDKSIEMWNKRHRKELEASRVVSLRST
jgi:hypothetical protein